MVNDTSPNNSDCSRVPARLVCYNSTDSTAVDGHPPSDVIFLSNLSPELENFDESGRSSDFRESFWEKF